MAHSIFPNTGTQVFSAFIHFVGVTCITYFLSRRLCVEELTTRRGWSRTTWPRLCVLLVLLDSWLFVFSTGVLIFGVGVEMNRILCAAGTYLCVAFYTTSKVLIYMFLTEKVYLVWGKSTRRLRSPVYLICMTSVLLYVLAILVVVIFGRITLFRSTDDEGTCDIGLKPTASVPLLVYDLYINILLTSLFLWPLFRLRISSPIVKRVAARTLVAAVATLATSTVNIGLLTGLRGGELGWICLGICGADVVLNAAAMFWVASASSAAPRTDLEENSITTTDMFQPEIITLDTVADIMHRGQ
ncbi:hypothetical protein GGX14DRAFT_525787 [Mycena pura]|uniref:Transmembrane protein n=1 Tax=Mycena pura TaxID=153505 RepID=A0AAD6V630_9AGAR|nr:hypothetical protein GGX14DRAFT_525787 [Mycena pura]